MERPTGPNRKSHSVLRWTARLWSLAIIALVIGFIVGERDNPSDAAEWIGFLFFPFGACVGMIVSWRREILGGVITVGSLLAFYAVQRAMAGAFPHGWAFPAFAAPGFLFLLAGGLARRAAKAGQQAAS